MTTTRYNWHWLRAGTLKLDGGSMFGVVPKTLWSRLAPADDRNRIQLAHNCILLWRTDSAGKKHQILIEVGSGDKFDAKSTQLFGLEGGDIVAALGRNGCDAREIEHVIVSHLHFDHAGGLTRRVREGETPDSNDPSPVKLTFPNATVHVQKREWDDATANNAVMTRTYLKDHLLPVREQMRFVESPDVYPRGHLPARDEAPASRLLDRCSEILPGIFGFKVPGHTWGQQAILFVDDRDRTVVFTPDVMPTVNHVGQPYNMAYDIEPYISSNSRRWFLDEAAKNDWLLILDHEAGEPQQKVRPDDKGWFKLISQGRE
jgi:glyoxylase-like metal-dependent hydrolase (beta-lactamase superfamily II)